jgi:hypothetical protein
MATAKAISGSSVKNNGSSLLFAGNVTRPEIGNLDFGSTNMNVVGQPNISGLTQKAISAGDFNVDNRLVSMGHTSSIAGVAIKVLKSGSGLQNRVKSLGAVSYTRSDLASFDMLTGLATYGSNAGDMVMFSGLDGSLGKDSDINNNSSYTVPHKLVFMQGGKNPVSKNYTGWTN